jgi:ABC-type multidrug transport system ATPase subunit
VTKKWQRLPEPVLDGVSFAVPNGAAIWITGGNGAGKTTLMRILSGLIRPDHGEVRLDGLCPETRRREYQQRVGTLAAGDRGLFARLSVRGHLQVWAGVAFVPRSQHAARIASTADRFGLEPLLNARVDRMSMGQRQRVRMAMTFLHQPMLVLLDEPLNSLDEEGADVLRSAIFDVLARGGACLWFSPGNDRPELDFRHHWRLAGGSLTAQ